MKWKENKQIYSCECNSITKESKLKSERKIGIVADILLYLGYWGTLVTALAFLLGVWLLTGGLEWCRRQFKFIVSAAQMPGPPALPIIGNALHFACSYNDLLPRVLELAKPYDAPFRFWMGTKLFIILRNPRDIEVVVSSPIATNKPYEYRFVASYMGVGIATGSGARHKAQRKLVLPMLNGKSLNSFFDCFDRQSKRCVECLEERVDKGEFDIMHYMDNCTLDIILETIMGTPGTAQQGEYKGLMDCAARAFGLSYERTMKAWLYNDFIYNNTKDGQQFTSDMKILHEFTDGLVNQKKKDYHASEHHSDPESEHLKPVLDRLTAHNEENKVLTDIQMRDEITNIWSPAQDPTALISSFMFVMLGMHQQVQDKLREEVREVIGESDITLDDLPKLKYLEMVFKETVRLFPVGPIVLRELQEDLKFESCTAPKGCTIALLVYVAHRDPKFWKEPEKFNPERFTPENSAGRHPFAYLPFSYGSRGCAGRHYATMLMKTLVARVVQKYRISHNGTLETFRLKAGVSIRSIDGYKVSIARV